MARVESYCIERKKKRNETKKKERKKEIWTRLNDVGSIPFSSFLCDGRPRMCSLHPPSFVRCCGRVRLNMCAPCRVVRLSAMK